ncbi:PAS domain-containing hybrid sensor histidine kinase/response regulator, partial [Cnuella takakiae]
PAGHTKHLYQKAVKNKDADGNTVDAVGGVIDITQLKKAEATFRQVVNASPNALLLVNTSGQIVLSNQQAEHLFGYSEEELKNSSVDRLIPARWAGNHDQRRKQYQEEPTHRTLGEGGELYAATKSGVEVPVEVGLSPMEMEGEKLVLASIVDISQRKAAEAERLELLTRFKLAANATNLGIWDFDLEKGTLLWNDNMYELAELPNTTPVNFEIWRSLVHPDDVDATVRNFQQAVEQADPTFEMEYRMQPASGKVKTLHQKAITFCNPDGVVVRCLGTSLDVTTERQADAIREELITRFELAAETLHLGILDADLRTGTVQGDTQLKLMLGIEAIPNPDWRVWIKQVHPEDRERLQDLLMQALPHGKLLEAEWRQVRTTGETRHFETKARIIWKNSQPSRLIAATIDITDRVNQRNELIAARITAEKSEQLQEQFLANMSHEIRTPLNGVVGMADLMGGTMLTQRQREYLQVIQNSSQGLLTIINDVLDISKIKAGKFAIENAPFNLHHVLISAFEMLQLRASQKNLNYQLQVDPDVPVMVKGDAGRLSQVLINLLGNAVKFTREGSVILTVHPAGEADGKRRLLFTVTDTGIGMSAEARHEVFNSFAQASREVGIEFGGTGLGLAISKQLVEMQGGTIEVESTLGLGSSFRVMIAYQVEKDGFVDKTEAKDLVPMDLHNGKRVLVAEDNEVNRMVINEYLQKAGLQVTLTNDGKQAVDTLLADPNYHLVILDLRMPVMNGFEAATAIRKELDLDLPIMALSASTLRSEKEHCLALGMNAYMAKPFKASELYDNIFRLLNGSAQQGGHTESTIEELAPGLFDLSELQALGEPDFALQIIDTFMENGKKTIGELTQALEEDKIATVFELSHRMKGSAGSLGALPLMEQLKEMETEARSSKPDRGRLQAMLSGVVKSFGQVCAAL